MKQGVNNAAFKEVALVAPRAGAWIETLALPVGSG